MSGVPEIALGVDDDAAALVLARLGAAPSEALFASALFAAARRSGVEAARVELALEMLRGKGRLVLRDNYCADPHLDGVDLRVVALVEAVGARDLAEREALERLDRTWNRWLGEYLANHRCT